MVEIKGEKLTCLKLPNESVADMVENALEWLRAWIMSLTYLTLIQLHHLSSLSRQGIYSLCVSVSSFLKCKQ